MTAVVSRARGRRPAVALAAALAIALLGLSVFSALRASAVTPTNAAFLRTWERTDKPVKDLVVARTWMWGDGALTGEKYEPYADAPGGQRLVQYFDKSRMEINNPAADQNNIWYVTNGLLVVEMITGNMQIGNNAFQPRSPASSINVAGDPDDTAGPTYGTIAMVRNRPALPAGSTIIQRLARDGTVSDDQALAGQGVTAAWRVTIDGIDHQVASVFWAFMNSNGTVWENGQYVSDNLFENPFYATGYPVTEAYWATVKVGGTPRNVLLQCFERRCLTYTPDNQPGWRVEAGNVGQHYYRWRYESASTPTPTATATTTPTATATPTETPVPLPEEQLFGATLSGDAIVANAAAAAVETDGAGQAYFYVRGDGTAIDYQVSTFDLANVTAARLYAGEPDENGDAIATLFSAQSGTAVTIDGVLSEGTLDAADLATGWTIAEVAQAMADGQTYIVIQTTAHPTGEVRGQLAEVGDTLFNAALNGQNEIPDAMTGATGTALFRYDQADETLDFRLDVFDIDGVTAAHIHEGASNENGPPVVTLFSASSPVNPQDGTLAEGTIANGDDAIGDGDVERVVYLMLTGNAYANVHTTQYPDGEIRGQIAVGSGIDTETEGTFVAELSGLNENPDVPTLAAGWAILSLNPDGSLDYTIVVSNLQDPTAAYVQLGGPDENGDVLVTLWDEDMSQPVEDGILVRGTLEPDEFDVLGVVYAMLTDQTYVNITTDDHPNGEIRGQLEPFDGEVALAELTPDEVEPSPDPVESFASGVALFFIEGSGASTSIDYVITVEDLEEPLSADLYWLPLDETSDPGEYVVNLFTVDPEHVPADTGILVEGSIAVDDLDGPFVDDEDLADLAAAILAGETYVQVTTENWPLGELRGQLLPIS